MNNMHLPFGPEKRNLMESGSFIAVSNKTPSRFPLLSGIVLFLVLPFLSAYCQMEDICTFSRSKDFKPTLACENLKLVFTTL